MEKKTKISEVIERDGRVTSSQLADEAGVSRQYVHAVISALAEQGRVLKFGSTRNAFYVTPEYAMKHPEELPSVFQKRYKNEGLEEHRVLVEAEEHLPLITRLPENIRSIFAFSFSEMLNNAIEHSRSKDVLVRVTLRGAELSFVVEDFGIGVFRNIMKTRKLRFEMEAIQDLLKGKTTTMPKSHSGEGIFFTSRCADIFLLESFGYELRMGRAGEDIDVRRPARSKRGTKVSLEISAKSKLHLGDIFKEYTNLGADSDHGFDKTEIRVKLFTLGGVHVSRSQARRILSGLDKFRVIVLDFDQVPMVGQAFADEIYRVFQNRYPDMDIREENMSEGVRFMVERAKEEAARRA